MGAINVEQRYADHRCDRNTRAAEVGQHLPIATGSAHCGPLASRPFKLTTALDSVSTYQCHTYAGQHRHCAICGCATWVESPDYGNGKPEFEHPIVSYNPHTACHPRRASLVRRGRRRRSDLGV